MSRDGGGGSAPRSVGVASTPPRGAERRTLPPGAGRSLTQDLMGLLSGGSSEEADVDMPRRNTLCVIAVVVALLAVLKSVLLPDAGPNSSSGGEGPVQVEDGLVRMVLAQELKGMSNTLQEQDRTFDMVQARRAKALEEIQMFREKVEASTVEVQELEELGKTVHDDNSGDAGLTTEVARAQGSLRDLHRSVMDELDGFKRQLEDQAETMRGVREGFARVGQLAERGEDRIAAAAHESLELRLEENLADLKGFYSIVKERVDDLSPDIITHSELEALLDRAAQPLGLDASSTTARGSSSDGSSGGSGEEQLRILSEAAVGRAVDRITKERYVGKSGGRGEGGGGEEGCVSEMGLREEVDAAIEKLRADGTGLRDYANAAVGGKVLTSKGMVSDTYTPGSWWGSSRYWHRAGVENGIGPVESIISEDSGLGACWAMAGSEGLVTIQLPREITVDGISVEHASRMVTIESASAPKEFQVVGMRNKNDNYPVKLGGGVYDVDGRAIQTFPITPLGVKFTVIQFKIVSNWGNPDYTCLYRVRVHGRETG
ncbi:unnamed protein product [Scytosiphon promiscuus]